MSKRVEIYIGFKCNNDCLFCVEHFRKKQHQATKVLQTQEEITALLNKYKNQGYDHLNILGGEPFLEKNFLPVLQTAKALGFLTAVTTNGSLLANEAISQSHLPLIDDLIVSIHGHNQDLISKQGGHQNLYDWLVKAFVNINQYFRGRILKSNVVINQLNYQHLPDIVKFIAQGGIKEISLTSMSIDSHNQDIAVKYQELVPYLQQVADYGSKNDLIIRLADLPFCLLGDNYHLANHLYFDQREKFDIDGQKVIFDRPKVKTAKCSACLAKDLCQGLDEEYYKIFGDEELKTIF